MNPLLRAGFLAFCLSSTGSTMAAASNESDLPASALAMEAINTHPAVAAARAAITLEEANRRRLQSGPYEYAFRVGGATRQDNATNRTMQEWDLTLERPWRLAGKSELDAQLGDQGIDQAKLSLGDARHESGRILLRLWFNWIKAAAQARHWQSQRDLLARQADIVARRTQLGDAARQERGLADAAVAQADYSLLQALMRQEVAAGELARTFPPIRGDRLPPLPEPRPIAEGLEYWQAHILENNHELGVARGEVRRQTIAAQRARAERTPDPTLGIRYASERSGSERVVGLVLTVPLAGALRQANAEASSAQVDIAGQRVAQVRRRLETEASATFTAAVRSFESWNKARAAAEAMEGNARLAATAYRLGELSLTELLASQRLSIEARLAATLVQLEAAETRYRLLLDAHRLWDFDEE